MTFFPKNHRATLLLKWAPLAVLGLLAGCAGGGGGSGANPSVTGPGSLVYSGTSRSFSQAQVDQIAAEQEFKNLSQYGEIRFFAGSSTDSSVHPLVLTNVHKAYGYGLSGRGQAVAVFDTGFSASQAFTQGSAFVEMQTKFNDGQIKLGSSLLAGTSSHGNQVASIAAAGRDAEGYNYYLNNTGLRYPSFVSNSYDLLNHGIMGVAYNATLHLYDVDSLNTFGLLAESIRSIADQGVVVQNNSWGLSTDTNTGRRFNRAEIISIPASLPASVASGTIEAASTWLESLTGFSSASWADYLSALESYQAKGVTVFALQNDSSASQPSLLAALPQVVPSLKPAWLAVGNIDTTGTTNLSIRRQSAACGQTASYCLMVDGTEITGAGLSNSGGGSPGYSFGQSGTSFAAPQVSGMVALLAEAFPSLTPEDLVNRLLATANNSFFTPTGERIFSNEIRHGYNDEFGHGIPDLYAALQPITSGSRPLSFVLNGSPRAGDAVAVAASSLRTSPTMGAEVQRALVEQTMLSYDALGAGFEIPIQRLLNTRARQTRLSDWLAATQDDGFEVQTLDEVFVGDQGIQLASGLSLNEFTGRMTTPQGLYAETGLPSPGIPKRYAEGFVLSGLSMASGFDVPRLGQLIGYVGKTTTLDARPAGIGMAATGQPNVYGAALAMPIGQGQVPSLSSQVLFGLQRENEALRGTQGFGAFNLAKYSNSFFISPSFQYSQDGWAFSAGASLGFTRAQADSKALIRSEGAIVSSEFYALASYANLFNTRDMGYLRIWQPETVESGSLLIKKPSLVGPEATLAFTSERVSLSARQRDIFVGLGYQHRLNASTRLQHEVLLLPSSQGVAGQPPELGLAVRLYHRF